MYRWVAIQTPEIPAKALALLLPNANCSVRSVVVSLLAVAQFLLPMLSGVRRPSFLVLFHVLGCDSSDFIGCFQRSSFLLPQFLALVG